MAVGAHDNREAMPHIEYRHLNCAARRPHLTCKHNGQNQRAQQANVARPAWRKANQRDDKQGQQQ